MEGDERSGGVGDTYVYMYTWCIICNFVVYVHACVI